MIALLYGVEVFSFNSYAYTYDDVHIFSIDATAVSFFCALPFGLWLVIGLDFYLFYIVFQYLGEFVLFSLKFYIVAGMVCVCVCVI